MTDQITIRGDVPISMHPDALLNIGKALDVDGTPGRSAYRSAREALGALYGTYARMKDAERAIHAAVPPSSWRPGEQVPAGWRIGRGGKLVVATGREREYAAAAKAAFDRAAATFDHRFREVRAARAQLDDKVRAAVHQPEDRRPEATALAAEVRSHFKGRGKRAMLELNNAIARGDRASVAAVLSAPAFLSGLDNEQQQAARRLAQHRFAPVEAAQVEAMERLDAHMMMASTHLVELFTKAVEAVPKLEAAADARIGELANG
jgi:hypothetical protein